MKDQDPTASVAVTVTSAVYPPRQALCSFHFPETFPAGVPAVGAGAGEVGAGVGDGAGAVGEGEGEGAGGVGPLGALPDQ